MLLGILTLALLPAPQTQQPAGFTMDPVVEEWSTQVDFADDGTGTYAHGPVALGGAVQLTVSVSPAPNVDASAAEQTRDSILLQVEGVDEIRGAKKRNRKIDGREAFGLQVEQDASGETYLARQYYVVRDGLLYIVQCHAPKDQFSKHEKPFEKAIDSLRFTALSAEALARTSLRALAARCGTEIDWAEDWKDAAARAKSEKKAILVVVQAISGFDVGDAIRLGPFMDPDILALMDHRFVVLQWHRGMQAPFEDHAIFGMGNNTFGDGMLITNAQGEVIEQLFLLETSAVYDVLLETVQDAARFPAPAPKPPSSADALARATFLFESGQLETAKAMMAAAPTPPDPAWLALEARMHFALRDAEACTEVLDRALMVMALLPQPRDALEHELKLLQIQLLTATGEAEAAEDAARRLLEEGDSLSEEDHAFALVLLGSLRLQAEDREQTEALWMEAVERFPDARWTWIAAGAMTFPGWSLDFYPDLRWPRAADRALSKTPTPATITGLGTAEQLQSAASFLIAEQREDGSWPSPTSYGDHDALGDDFELAATAIASHALLRMQNHAEAQAAALRGLDWILAQRILRDAEEDDPVVFMDYTVWSRSYMLFFLAACLEQEVGEAAAIEQEIQRCLGELQDRQQANGGWSYYLSGTIDGDALPQAISFTTATVVLAFERIQARGLLNDASSNALARGLRSLEQMRSPGEGTFAYFLNGREVETGTRSSTGIEGAAARGPVCALALWRGERETSEEVLPRCTLFLEHLAPFAAERRKALMHAGLQAQGSHYLLYDYSTAAETLRALVEAKAVPSKLEKGMRKALLREIEACRNDNGSYVDNPLIGVHSGTGLAMMALLDLEASSR